MKKNKQIPLINLNQLRSEFVKYYDEDVVSIKKDIRKECIYSADKEPLSYSLNKAVMENKDIIQWLKSIPREILESEIYEQTDDNMNIDLFSTAICLETMRLGYGTEVSKSRMKKVIPSIILSLGIEALRRDQKSEFNIKYPDNHSWDICSFKPEITEK